MSEEEKKPKYILYQGQVYRRQDGSFTASEIVNVDERIERLEDGDKHKGLVGK